MVQGVDYRYLWGFGKVLAGVLVDWLLRVGSSGSGGVLSGG
jgi:hypothetical protein